MLKEISYRVKCVTLLMFICHGFQGLASLDCNFDEGFCNWIQDKTDDSDWLRITPSWWWTGPSSSHTTAGTNYIHIEVNGQNKGHISRLNSPEQKPGLYCLEFWYSRYGWHVGTLNVYIKSDGGNKSVIYSKTDVYTQDWRNIVIGINIPDGFKIVIEAIRGNGNNGDIAIDDISVTKGTCSDCNFDNGLCRWTQVDDDDFNWKLNKGQTKSNDTGPSSDHTSGNGSYIYIETTGRDGDDIAVLASPLQQAGKYCVSFWYHMYGDHVDRFSVGQWNGTAQELFSKTGNQGKNWIHGNIFIKSTTNFKVFLAGKVKNANYRFKGDIAVDDVSVMSCPDCHNPAQDHAIVNAANFEYGSVVEVTCNFGYILTGDSHMVCLAGGAWNASRPSCKSYDCGNGTILNGHFSAPEGTTFGQTATHVCNIGYTLVGDTTVTCTVSGWNGTAATCEIVDCGNRTLLKGHFSAPEGTTFGQTATHVCDVGYTLVGDTTLTCTVSGWKGTAATCEIVDADNNALIAVYVLVPVTVVILAVLFTIIFVRRRFQNCKNVSESKHESRKNPVMTASNKTYTGVALESQNHINHAYEDESLQLNDEYATISDEQKVNSNNIDYNIVSAAETSKEHDAHNYDHMKETAAHFVDESYSHVSRNKSGTTFEPSYNTTLHLDAGNAPLRTHTQSDLNSYDLLNISNCNETAKQRNETDNRKESDYDHAHAGGIDPPALDEDAYSHLNDTKMKQKCLASFNSGNDHTFEDSNVNENFRKTEKEVEKSEAGYEQERGLASQYELQDTINDDRHYFVLEAEEVMDELNGSENHDYFVLEKTES